MFNKALPSHDKYLAFSEVLADESRRMILDARKKTLEIDVKDDASLVTSTDKLVEARLREMIGNTFPDHGIFGEELENVNEDAEFVWVLDPIDGTAPFIAGIPVYGSLIALAWEGKPFVGVIDHPVTQDRWTGVAEKEAYYNGTSVRVRPCCSIESAFATCSNVDFMPSEDQERFQVIRKRVRYVQYGGSCYSYGVLASGRTDLAIDSGLKAFDVYAPAAVILGAGGYISDWNGNELSFDMKGTVLAAGDKERFMECQEILGKG